YAGSLADAAAREELHSINEVESLALAASPALNALEFLAPAEHIKVLAEVKRASPSKGAMAEIADPAALASTYATNGASAISVLTEERKFKGSLDDLRAVRAAVDVPLLRKDFIANEYQILEARAAGADIILLIVAGLDQATLIRLKAFAESLGMTAFVETHDHNEVLRAIDTGARLIGVNARDLSTFETDRDLFGTLRGLFPADVITVAESAVRTADDVRHYRAAGADVVLVGEALVTNDAALMLQSFLAV
ncbi:MAG: indole-3-glycerol phosphate synthase TrpC, partial [Actinomycetales bacterium]|nr:indole-3-glycerol phosphate synthase TrpC [Actinomycetales bacterium]